MDGQRVATSARWDDSRLWQLALGDEPKIRLYLPLVMRAGMPGARLAAASGAPPSPPATYYGAVNGGGLFTPQPGMPVAALIDGTTCGQSVTKSTQAGVVYSVDVVAEGPGGSDGCGAAGRAVVFQVGGHFMAPTAPWDNAALHDLPLYPMQPPAAPGAEIERAGESLVLEWPAVTKDAAGRATEVTGYRVWRGERPYFTPGSGCACTVVGSVAGLSFTDTGVGGADVVGDVTHNYSYVVTAVNAAGESVGSSAVGEFDFALARGAP